MKTDTGHVLANPDTCPARVADPEGHARREREDCPVCDWGFGVCVKCGMAEVELDQPCPGFICPHCRNTGIDRREFDGDGRLTGCACDCPAGHAYIEEWLREHPEDR